MKKIVLLMLCIFGLMCELLASEKLSTTQNAYAVKIDGQISPPQLFIVKRAIRMASNEGVKILAIDIDTPGGDLDTTLKIMQALRDFEATLSERNYEKRKGFFERLKDSMKGD